MSQIVEEAIERSKQEAWRWKQSWYPVGMATREELEDLAQPLSTCTIPHHSMPYQPAPWVAPDFGQPGQPYQPSPWVQPPSWGTPVSPAPQQGWLCPACGKGCAPFLTQCPCPGRQTDLSKGSNITITHSVTGAVEAHRSPDAESPR